MNSTALSEYNKQLNIYAVVQDYLITYTTNLIISTSNSIKLQSFSLSQLTEATNQLTRTTCVRILNVRNVYFYSFNRHWLQKNVIN